MSGPAHKSEGISQNSNKMTRGNPFEPHRIVNVDHSVASANQTSTAPIFKKIVPGSHSMVKVLATKSVSPIRNDLSIRHRFDIVLVDILSMTIKAQFDIELTRRF